MPSFTPIPCVGALLDGEDVLFTVISDGSQPLKGTLCWSELPSPVDMFASVDPATLRLVNDLDLRLVAPDGTNHCVTFNSIPGLTYRMEFSTDLVNWTEEPGDLPAVNESSTFNTVKPGYPRGFWRVRQLAL